MGKISNYASALKAKLTDFFVIASDNNGVLETKKVTTEQIGDAVASDQVHSSLNTSDKTLIGGINEVNSNVGTLSSLTTTEKSSLVGAVNEVVSNKADANTALTVVMGSGSGAGQTFTMETGGSTNACWLVFFGGTYVGIVTIFSTNIAIARVAGSINATVSLSGTTITISLSGAPWTQLRYVKLFA